MSTEAKEPGQRAYEAYAAALGDDPAGERWGMGEAEYKHAWAAAEAAAYARGLADGAERERAAVVEYAREMSEYGESVPVADIESGKHLAGESE